MALDWFWEALGLDPRLPLPTVTRAWLSSLRKERIQKLKDAGAAVHEIVKVNMAYGEAKRLVVD